jgi:hypothetical protein
VVCGPGQHAGELRPSHACLELHGLLLGLGDERFVVLFCGELEELFRVDDLLGQRLDDVDFFDDRRALPERYLRFGLVVPEPGFARELV